MSLSQASTKVQEEGDEIEAGQPLPQGLATHTDHCAMCSAQSAVQRSAMSITLANFFDVSNSHVPEPRTVGKRETEMTTRSKKHFMKSLMNEEGRRMYGSMLGLRLSGGRYLPLHSRRSADLGS